MSVCFVPVRQCGACPFWQDILWCGCIPNLDIRHRLCDFADICAVVLYCGARQRKHRVMLHRLFVGIHFTHTFGRNSLGRIVFVSRSIGGYVRDIGSHRFGTKITGKRKSNQIILFYPACNCHARLRRLGNRTKVTAKIRLCRTKINISVDCIYSCSSDIFNIFFACKKTR